MFKKLHSMNEDSSLNYNNQISKQQITYKKNFNKNTLLNKKTASYGEKFRKQNNLLPNVPQLQIIQTDLFLFQGRLASALVGSKNHFNQKQKNNQPLTEKHGQGIMFLKNGTLIIGNWDHGLLNGRALIFTPFGGKTIAEFYNGKINGWAITKFSQKLIIIAAYYQNKIDGQKIIYEATQQMWVGSKFLKQSNAYQIIHVQKGKCSELPNFLKPNISNQLIQLYGEFINNQNTCLYLNEIQFFSITENLNYIGYCDEQHHPYGLGAIYGKNQFYLGHFRDGSLQCYGRMIFQNGQIYHGQLLNGQFYGQGVYYNPTKNLSTIMYANRDESKILDQQQGYICINIPFNYFKYSKYSQTGMIGQPLASINQILEKYYSRYFIQKKKNHKGDNISVHSQFGISENNQDVDSSLYPVGSPKKDFEKQKTNLKNKKNQQTQNQKWLDFNKGKQSLNMDSSVYHESQNYQLEIQNLQRTYSLDKRQAEHARKHLAQQSIPLNIDGYGKNSKMRTGTLQDQMSRLKLDRNFSLRQKKYQNLNSLDILKVKENIQPKQEKNLQAKNEDKKTNQPLKSTFMIKPVVASINQMSKQQKKSSLDILTFRNQNNNNDQIKVIDEIKNERKYSHMIQASGPVNQHEDNQSGISRIQQKVDYLVKKSSSKRRKIFM